MICKMNYTAEDLKNTKIRIESPEHSKYVQELAFGLGFGWRRLGQEVEHTEKPHLYLGENFYISFSENEDYFNKQREKEIKIPMPEKEFPQVGDNVTWMCGKRVITGDVKSISDGLAWIKNEYGSYVTEYVSALSKPKTPEQELREYLSKLIVHSSKEICDTPLNNDDADFMADRLIDKLSITKKVDK